MQETILCIVTKDPKHVLQDESFVSNVVFPFQKTKKTKKKKQQTLCMTRDARFP